MCTSCTDKVREKVPSFKDVTGYRNIRRKKVSKGAKIRNRYNTVPNLTQNTNWKVTNLQLYTTNESQEVNPFQASDETSQFFFEN